MTCFSSCIRDADVSSTSCVDTHVQLVIGNAKSRAIGDASPDPINRLRVYAFNGNVCVGYLFRDNLNTSEIISLPMPIDKTKASVNSDINFYVLANDNDNSLSQNTSRLDLNSKSFLRWEDNTVPDVAPMVNNDNTDGKGGYLTKVKLTGEKWQNVNINIQSIVGRLRLFFKKEGNGEIIINSAAVYHRPDNYLLFTPISVASVTFDNNGEDISDNFVSGYELDDMEDYQLVGKTYLAPNAYGSSNPDVYVPAYGNESDKDKAYILRINYSVGGVLKTKDVYLPQVLRNRSIDVQGILKSGSLNLEVNIKDWTDGPSFDMNYDNEFNGLLNLVSKNPIIGEQDKKAYAVVYGDAIDTRHDLTFELKIDKPIGATWAANVTDGANFEVVKTDGTSASGIIDGKSVSITLRSKSKFATEKVFETEMYVTLINNIGENKGKQLINPGNPNPKHPGGTDYIRVRQISLDEWNSIQSSTQP